MEYSDYIVFIDESGTAELKTIDPDYPIFVLSCILVAKEEYRKKIVPRFHKLKFQYFGHDQVIFHENEMRRGDGPFLRLRRNASLRNQFFSDIAKSVQRSDFFLYLATINKLRLKERYTYPSNPYALGLQFCLEAMCSRLVSLQQTGKEVHILFEKRGANEDSDLELQCRRILDGQGPLHNDNAALFQKFKWSPMFISKKSNSTGIQLADMAARPFGLNWLKPNQTNRACDAFNGHVKMNKYFP